MSASTGVAPARRMELTEAKKLKGVVTTAMPEPDAGGGQGQPQGIGARGAAHGVGHAQLRGCGLLECGYRLAKDELLRLKHMVHRIQQFPVERAVLALEVQHGYRLGGCSGTPRRGWRVFHPTMLTAAQGVASRRGRAQSSPGQESCGGLELKRLLIRGNVVRLRDQPVPGLPEPRLSNLFLRARAVWWHSNP